MEKAVTYERRGEIRTKGPGAFAPLGQALEGLLLTRRRDKAKVHRAGKLETYI